MTKRSDKRRKYDLFADSVGLVPNLRRRDNLYQGICVAVFAVVGVTVGWIYRGWPSGAVLGLLGGLVVGLFLSGLILMVVGLSRNWRREVRKQ